jgi:hypothetical protein
MQSIRQAKQIICPLGLQVEKFTCATMIVLYIMDLSTNTSRNALFVDSAGLIVEKMVVMIKTASETEEKASLKMCFSTFLSFLI